MVTLSGSDCDLRCVGPVGLTSPELRLGSARFGQPTLCDRAPRDPSSSEPQSTCREVSIKKAGSEQAPNTLPVSIPGTFPTGKEGSDTRRQEPPDPTCLSPPSPLGNSLVSISTGYDFT
jgi:hypothetical protein